MNERSNCFAMVIIGVLIVQFTLIKFVITQAPYRTESFRAALFHGIKGKMKFLV